MRRLLPLLLAALPLAAQPRDVLASAFTHPLLTDAEVVRHLADDRAVLEGAGGPVLVRYPHAAGLRVDGQPARTQRVAEDLVRAELPAGRHEVQVLTDPAAPPLPPLAPGGIASAEAMKQRVAALAPGDEVVIADGVYADWRVEIAGEGTAERPIVVRPQTPGGVTFRRRTMLRLSGRHIVLRGFRFEHCGPDVVVHLREADDCRVTQCQFFHCGSVASTFAHIVDVDMGSSRNRVDHGYWTGSKSMSLAQRVRAEGEVGTDNRFDHNLFRDIWRYWINGQENIQIGQNQRGASGAEQPRLTVEHNVMDHAWGDGEIISNKAFGNLIRHNLAAWCPRSSFTLRGGDAVRFEGNVVVGCGDGLRVMGRHHTIVNNLILDAAGWGICFETGSRDGESQVASEGSLVAHNTIIGCGAGAIGAMPTTEARPHAPTGNRLVGNLLAGGSGVLIAREGLVETEFGRNLLWATGSATPGAAGDGALLADPRLEGEGLGLRPGPGSPAIDAGARLEAVPLDRWGRARPAGAAPDLGADEVGAQDGVEPVVLPPLPPRPLLDLSLYEAEPVPMPADAWTLADEARALPDLPGDVVLRWECQPEAFASQAGLEFALDGTGRGYRLSWGGAAADGKPLGAITLRKLGSDDVVADGADLRFYYQDFRPQAWLGRTLNERAEPDPAVWQAFTLLKQAGRLVLLLRDARGEDIPVLIWHDRGLVGGPVPAGTGCRAVQQGRGRWRGFSARVCRYTGDQPVPAPAGLAAEAHGGGRIRLHWTPAERSGLRCDVLRNGAPVATELAGSAFDDFDIVPNTRYAYTVVARNALGRTSPPAAVEATSGQGGRLYRLARPRAEATVPPLAFVPASEASPAFVWAPAGLPRSQTEPPAAGEAAFGLDLPAAGRYALWGLVQAPDAGSDSFWAALDQAAPAIWYTGVHPAWTWSPVAEPVDLPAGAHVLRIRHREPGAKLAAVMVTDDLDWRP